MLRYGYRTQGINTYYEEGEDKENKFVFYTVSLLKIRETTREWIGNVYGKTMWETVAKIIIKVYADLKKEKAEQ